MSFYTRLPDELKLEIWKKAITPEHGGVHHFKIGFHSPRRYEQTLIVYPSRDNVNDDPSSWVDLWRLSLASRMSWDLVEKSNHADRALFWQKAPRQNIMEASRRPSLPASKGPVKTPQEELDAVGGVPSHKIPRPTQAFINGDKDLVYFTVIGSDFYLGWIHWENNRQRFRHVTNVAFNYFNPVVNPRNWLSSPFECSCGNACTEDGAGFCVYAMCWFLCIFENLKNVYITIPIRADRIHQPALEPLPRGTKRGHGGQAIKKTGSQLVTEAMDKFEAIALEKGLSIFQDRKKTYYQIDDSGLRVLKDCPHHQTTLKDLAETWIGDHDHPTLPGPYDTGANWRHVKFQFLVYRAWPGGERQT